MKISKRLFESYIKLICIAYPVIKPFSLVTNILTIRGVDVALRYKEADKMIKGETILEVGADMYSPILQLHSKTITTDIKNEPGVMALASATDLPFKDKSFDSVVAIDVIEHIPKNIREKTIEEMIRVATRRVIITCPLEDGNDYRGRQMDITFNEWHRNKHGSDVAYTLEHINRGEPEPAEFLKHGFNIIPMNNTRIWMNYMMIQYSFKSKILNILSCAAAQCYYAIHAREDRTPPYWGGLCILDKE